MRVNRFTARFDGECEGCGVLISEGDEAGYVRDDVCCEECCDEAEAEGD